MNLTEIFNAINNDWKIMVAVFGLGAVYYQVKGWVNKLNKKLDEKEPETTKHTSVIESVIDKLDSHENRIERIENAVIDITTDTRSQAVKIAVLETQVNADHKSR